MTKVDEWRVGTNGGVLCIYKPNSAQFVTFSEDMSALCISGGVCEVPFSVIDALRKLGQESQHPSDGEKR